MDSKKKKIGKWKTLGTEYLFRKPWLTARRDTVELPDGRVFDEFYILEYPAWVNIIAITDDDKFVMVRQYRRGLDDVFVELCAGCVEDGESDLAAAQRELLEETGYSGGEWTRFEQYSGNASTTTNLSTTFIARGVKLHDTQHLDPSEDIAVELYSRDEILGMLQRNEIVQSLMAAPLWHFFYNEKA